MTAGWTAVILLAIVGFAAFGTPENQTPQVGAQAETANMGHTAGAYAGLTFALLASDPAAITSSDTGYSTPSDDDLLSGANGRATGSEQTAEKPDPDANGWLSQVQVRALVSQYFTAEDVNHAVRVAWCESRFNPESMNLRTGGIGLFQHLPKYWSSRAAAAGFPGAEPTDPEASVAAAAWAVYEGGGWDVFTCRG